MWKVWSREGENRTERASFRTLGPRPNLPRPCRVHAHNPGPVPAHAPAPSPPPPHSRVTPRHLAWPPFGFPGIKRGPWLGAERKLVTGLAKPDGVGMAAGEVWSAAKWWDGRVACVCLRKGRIPTRPTTPPLPRPSPFHPPSPATAASHSNSAPAPCASPTGIEPFSLPLTLHCAPRSRYPTATIVLCRPISHLASEKMKGR